MSESQPRYGNICYIEIPAPDLEKASSFYTNVFGWKIQDSDLGKAAYAMFQAGDMMGGLDSRKEVSGHGVLLYLQVENIPLQLQAIQKAGGKVVMERTQVIEGSDQYGFAATFNDPHGNLLGLWAQT